METLISRHWGKTTAEMDTNSFLMEVAMRLQEKSINQVTTGTNVNCPCNKYYEGEKEMITLLRLHDRVILTLLKRLEGPFIPSKGTGGGQRTT